MKLWAGESNRKILCCVSMLYESKLGAACHSGDRRCFCVIFRILTRCLSTYRMEQSSTKRFKSTRIALKSTAVVTTPNVTFHLREGMP